VDFSAPYSLGFGSWFVLVWVAEEAEPFLGVGGGVLVEWGVVDARWWPRNLSVVGW
jgi:hypothetical protein